jgi:hypothetical protein
LLPRPGMLQFLGLSHKKAKDTKKNSVSVF